MESKCINAQIVKCDIVQATEVSDSYFVLYLKTANDTPILHVRYGDFAFELLEILDVKTWSRLPDTCLRLNIRGGKLIELGHIVDNNWLLERDWTFAHQNKF